MMEQSTLLQKTQDLIASGQIEEALHHLKQSIKEHKQLNASASINKWEKTIILLQSQLSDLKIEKYVGTRNSESVNQEKAQIKSAILEIASSLKREGSQAITQDRNDEEQQSTTSCTPVAIRRAELTIDGDFDSYSEEDKANLLKAIGFLLSMNDDLSIKKIRRGSIKISIDIPEEKYQLLLEHFQEGALDLFNVVAIDGIQRNKATYTLDNRAYSKRKSPTRTTREQGSKSGPRVIVSVKKELQLLYQVQLIDSELDEIAILKRELLSEVQDLEDEITGLQARVLRLKTNVEDMKKDLAKLRDKNIDSQALIEEYNDQKDQLISTREIDALSKKIESIQLDIQLSKQKIEGIKVQLIGREEALSAANERLKSKEEALEKKKVELEGIIRKTEEEEKKLVKKSQALKQRINPKLLKAYEKVRSAYRNGLAVVPLHRGACGGCFNSVPDKVQFEIHQGEKIIACEHCGRILVDPDILSEDSQNESHSSGQKLNKD